MATKITLKVDGMMCKNCVAHVKKALEDASGVEANVDLTSGKAVLEASGDIIDKLKQAVEDAGYNVTKITVDMTK